MEARGIVVDSITFQADEPGTLGRRLAEWFRAHPDAEIISQHDFALPPDPARRELISGTAPAQLLTILVFQEEEENGID